MNLLVTGGAGYIGSHTVRRLMEAGHGVTVLDNLSSGHVEALPPGAAFERVDLLDQGAVRDLFARIKPEGVVHFAALIEVGESMRAPGRYYRNNVVGSLNLLQANAETVKAPVVFSSTAAVYGDAEVTPIPEGAPKGPTSVYGETKLMTEQMLGAFERAHGIRNIKLRYFNVCGAEPGGAIGEDHPNKTHLIELALLTALGQREKMLIFGEDYPTPDGTCIRDYIHVVDLADAHVLAVQALQDGVASTAYNVGLGHGFSVKQVLDAVDAVIAEDGLPPLTREVAPRRPGDPPSLVADSRRIQGDLGWTPHFTDLRGIIRTAWEWHRSHPHGFKR
ncbi:UDP-glucose 4-epimerase GalE [Deinococcus planocerae]|uniref:UDP-glucose 4-epimerase GalE n=1 Tax=Deinococcus planocerae TaxID=1737569 RepID=UPI000C7EE43D|nr:UDP-glucose 4-epimerase GalE [Deinococcus planocerae]